jgi:hypothetical protein
MRAIEFDSFIEGDVIRVPEQYRNTARNAVKVIVMFGDEIAPVGGLTHKPKPVGPEDFTELKIPTRGWKFDREEANERR